MKIICSRNANKNLSDFTKFPANMFLFRARKNICTTPFFGAQQLHSWSTLKANVCIFLYISLKKNYFSEKVLSGGGWAWGRLKVFNAAHCLDHAKCFTIFHFNWNFWKLGCFFSVSILLSIALKHWNFQDNLDFKGKIAAKFLITNHFLSIQNNMIKKTHPNSSPHSITCQTLSIFF